MKFHLKTSFEKLEVPEISSNLKIPFNLLCLFYVVIQEHRYVQHNWKNLTFSETVKLFKANLILQLLNRVNPVLLSLTVNNIVPHISVFSIDWKMAHQLLLLGRFLLHIEKKRFPVYICFIFSYNIL